MLPPGTKRGNRGSLDRPPPPPPPPPGFDADDDATDLDGGEDDVTLPPAYGDFRGQVRPQADPEQAEEGVSQPRPSRPRRQKPRPKDSGDA